MLNCGIVLVNLPSFGRPLQILDGQLKKTVFGRLFIILTAIGLLINFMMASQNLSLLQYSWWPQLAKQSLYKIFPLPFNVSYFLDNRCRQCQCVQYTHSKSYKPTPDIACKCLNTNKKVSAIAMTTVRLQNNVSINFKNDSGEPRVFNCLY